MPIAAKAFILGGGHALRVGERFELPEGSTIEAFKMHGLAEEEPEAPAAVPEPAAPKRRRKRAASAEATVQTAG
jgi:hypothetical protein